MKKIGSLVLVLYFMVAMFVGCTQVSATDPFQSREEVEQQSFNPRLFQYEDLNISDNGEIVVNCLDLLKYSGKTGLAFSIQLCLDGYGDASHGLPLEYIESNDKKMELEICKGIKLYDDWQTIHDVMNAWPCRVQPKDDNSRNFDTYTDAFSRYAPDIVMSIFCFIGYEGEIYSTIEAAEMIDNDVSAYPIIQELKSLTVIVKFGILAL